MRRFFLAARYPVGVGIKKHLRGTMAEPVLGSLTLAEVQTVMETIIVKNIFSTTSAINQMCYCVERMEV
jgi:hypothetical protein